MPIMACFGELLVNKRGELTMGWELLLPPVYSLKEEDFADLSASVLAAIRVLPPWFVIHRQDLYLYERYVPKQKESFLGASYERHFAGRRYLDHKPRLFLTESSRAVINADNGAAGVMAGFGRLPFKKITAARIDEFRQKAEEFISTVCRVSKVSYRVLTREDYIGPEDGFGVLEESYLLGMRDGVRSDLKLTGENISYAGTKIFSFHVGETKDLPTELSDVQKIESLSSEDSSVYLSFGAKTGLLLGCEHIVNHYLVTVPQVLAEQELESQRKRKHSGADRADNEVGAEESREFIRSMHSSSSMVVLCSMNIVGWCSEGDYIHSLSRVGTALSSMGIKVSHNLIDTPVLWYAGIPGAGSELGLECFMKMEAASACCMYAWETYTKGEKGSNYTIVDRLRNIPVGMTVNAAAYEAGKIQDYNAMVIGPTGSGKSFFMNEYLRNCFDDGADITVIDIGNSYEGQTQVVNEESGGKDGFYYAWDDQHRFSFNPFVDVRSWVSDEGVLQAAHQDVIFFTCFLQTLWKPKGGWGSDESAVLSKIIRDFSVWSRQRKEVLLFDDFVKYVDGEVADRISYQGPDEERKKGFYIGNSKAPVTLSNFDVYSFSRALEPYSQLGTYGFLLNDPDPADLFSSRWVVFEVDQLSRDDSLTGRMFYSICILCIMNAFQRKMRQDTSRFKILVIEEAWKAISNETMAPMLRENWKVGRKFSVSNIVVTQQVSDLVGAEGADATPEQRVMKDTIVANSGTRVLLDQTIALSSFPSLASLLKLNAVDRALVLSLNKSLDPRFKYREVFISRGGQSVVYANEVSVEEALVFESNYKKKLPLMQKAAELHSMCQAAKLFADKIREDLLKR